MELKRTILAVALSMAVLFAFNYYLAPEKKAVPRAPTTAGRPSPDVAVEDAPAVSQTRGVVPAAESDVAVTRAVLENELVSVEISNRAAAIVGARLQAYKDQPGAGGKPVELLSAPSGLDLVGASQLQVGQPGWGNVYQEEERSSAAIAYSLETPAGLQVRKTYALGPGRYDVDLTVHIRNGSSQTLRDRLGVVMVQDFSSREDRYAFTGPAYYKGENFEEVKLKKLKEGIQDSGSIEWAALLEKYFLVAVVPQQAEGNSLAAETHLGMEKVAEVELSTSVFELPPGGEQSFQYRIFLGPKEVTELSRLDAHLQKVVDYGFFHIIAQPLQIFLNAIYSVTGNYGIAIILLTTCIKAVFWPLSARSFKSMQRMKELQPKVQKLKERYGKDKERLNTEMMQLYKTHKANPMGGCLPMVVQIPFFFALYRILLNSIELRHAPFFFWIQDLAAKDPYYITPLLMGASMFLQQRMTPATAGTEGQMKMMMYGMPVVFTVMFLNFPSGLVVYWLVNNLLSIAQQGMMLRRAKPAS